MKLHIYSVILLSALIFVSVFGFLWMSFLNHDMHSLCPFSMFGNADCAFMNNVFSSIAHHVSGVQYLGHSFISVSFAAFLAFIFFFTVLYTVLRQGFYIPQKMNFFAHRALQDEAVYQRYSPLLSWLSLHNKQDALLSKWAYMTHL